jgi:hypothetical protein
MSTRREIVEVFRAEYHSASLKRKSELLDAFTKSTGLSRKHSIALLNQKTKEKCSKARMRGRRSDFGKEEIQILSKAWHLASCICSKRLRPFLPELLNELEKSGVRISRETSSKVRKMSARTIDRLLQGERTRYRRPLATTRPGSLLKHQIPIHTFSEWDNVKPGFLEVDTVGHCASSIAGQFIYSLNLTDVATGWTEMIALKERTADSVIKGFEKVVTRLPFPILGLDCDNGKEFINESVIGWCKGNSVSFTRSREYKKNDQAWIEEKNRSVVRKHVGHARFEGAKACHVLNQYYEVLRLYVNFFQPCQKLLTKERNGSKTYKKYDIARTPYQRVLESQHVSAKLKLQLKKKRRCLSMVELHEDLFDLGNRLRQLAIDPASPLAAALASQRMSTFKFIETPFTEGKAETEVGPKNGQVLNMAQRMRRHLLLFPSGHTFRPCDFRHIAPRHLIDVYLRRWTEKKTLIKVGWGRYQKSAN